jgi:hypothetical protein
MFDALMNHLEKEEWGESTPTEGSQNHSKNHMHRELKKVKFPEFWRSIDGQVVEA